MSSHERNMEKHKPDMIRKIFDEIRFFWFCQNPKKTFWDVKGNLYLERRMGVVRTTGRPQWAFKKYSI